MRTKIVAIPIAVGALALPLKYSPNDGIAVSGACAQQEVPSTGTCCYQLRATCVIGGYVGPNKYYLSEGKCP